MNLEKIDGVSSLSTIPTERHTQSSYLPKSNDIVALVTSMILPYIDENVSDHQFIQLQLQLQKCLKKNLVGAIKLKEEKRCIQQNKH